MGFLRVIPYTKKVNQRFINLLTLSTQNGLISGGQVSNLSRGTLFEASIIIIVWSKGLTSELFELAISSEKIGTENLYIRINIFMAVSVTVYIN